MIRDLIFASAATTLMGTACLEAWFLVRYPDVLALVGLALSIAAGPAILWLRGTRPLVPISAVYCVLMFFVLMFIGFNLGWAKGLLEL